MLAPKSLNDAAPRTAARAQPRKRAASRAKQTDRAQELRSLEARIDGIRIHASERPPRRRCRKQNADVAVILIHGAGLDHRDWTFSLLRALDSDRRVLMFDRPGFGRSGRHGGLGSALPSAQARLLRRAAERFGVRRAVVVGHSWGAAVAMAWGLDSPDGVVGAVSIAGAVAPWSFACSLRNGARLRAGALTAFSADGQRRATETAMQTAFSPKAVPKGYLNHIARAADSRAAAATLSDLTTINGALALMAPRYQGFSAPVELLYGDADEILSAEEQGVAATRLLPSAKLTVLRGRGHMLHHSDPSTCADAIGRVLAQA